MFKGDRIQHTSALSLPSIDAASEGGLRRRLLGCASACNVDGHSLGSGAAGAGAPSTVAMLLLSHRLRAEPVDKISVYVTMDAPDPVLGERAAKRSVCSPGEVGDGCCVIYCRSCAGFDIPRTVIFTMRICWAAVVRHQGS